MWPLPVFITCTTAVNFEPDRIIKGRAITPGTRFIVPSRVENNEEPACLGSCRAVHFIYSTQTIDPQKSIRAFSIILNMQCIFNVLTALLQLFHKRQSSHVRIH